MQATTPSGRRPPDRTSPERDSFCYIRIDLTGRLTVLHAPDGGADLFPLGRRTASGTVERLDLSDDLAVWLDGDAQHAGIGTNWAATHLYRALSTPPPDAPPEPIWLHGPAIITGYEGRRPVSLTPAQRDQLASRHVRRPRLSALA